MEKNDLVCVDWVAEAEKIREDIVYSDSLGDLTVRMCSRNEIVPKGYGKATIYRGEEPFTFIFKLKE